MVINGVKFRTATVTWEDACGCENHQYLPDFAAMREGNEWVGAITETTGWTAVIGTYTVIVTKYNSHEQIYDYTLIPFTKTKIEYHAKKKK